MGSIKQYLESPATLECVPVRKTKGGVFGIKDSLSSKLQLDSEMDATVTIYMADGTAWDLPAVHLVKSSVDTLDINAALDTAPDSPVIVSPSATTCKLL